MTTQINLTIGDQRLLEQLKTRSAANQQALDDRNTAKQTVTEVANQAATAAEERLERQ